MLHSITRYPGLPLRLRRKIGKLAGKPAPRKDFRLPVFDVIYQGQTGAHLDDKIYLYGCHEAATIRLIRELLKKRKAAGKVYDFMDIGTNTGLHLITASPLARKAWGFEPYEAVRIKAAENITLNQLENAHIFDFGLSDSPAYLSYTPPDANNHGNGYFSPEKRHGSVAPAAADLQLRVEKGDEIVRENDIRPGVIKIDVEGFEAFVLQGLKNSLQKYRPDVIFEYNAATSRHIGGNTQPTEALETIREALGPDYILYGIPRSREYPRPMPFRQGRKYENIWAQANISPE